MAIRHQIPYLLEPLFNGDNILSFDHVEVTKDQILAVLDTLSDEQITALGITEGAGITKDQVIDALGTLSTSELSGLGITSVTRAQQNLISEVPTLSATLNAFATDHQTEDWEATTDVEIALSEQPVTTLEQFRALTWESTHDRSGFSNPIQRYIYLRLNLDLEDIHNYRVFVENDDGADEYISNFNLQVEGDNYGYYVRGNTHAQYPFFFAGLTVIRAETYAFHNRVSLHRLPIITSLLTEALSVDEKTGLGLFDPAPWARLGNASALPSSKIAAGSIVESKLSAAVIAKLNSDSSTTPVIGASSDYVTELPAATAELLGQQRRLTAQSGELTPGLYEVVNGDPQNTELTAGLIFAPNLYGYSVAPGAGAPYRQGGSFTDTPPDSLITVYSNINSIFVVVKTGEANPAFIEVGEDRYSLTRTSVDTDGGNAWGGFNYDVFEAQAGLAWTDGQVINLKILNADESSYFSSPSFEWDKKADNLLREDIVLPESATLKINTIAADVQTVQEEVQDNRTLLGRFQLALGEFQESIAPLFDYASDEAAGARLREGISAVRGLFYSFENASHASLANRETGETVSLNTDRASDIVGNVSLFTSGRGSAVRRGTLGLASLANKNDILLTYNLLLASSASIADTDLIRVVDSSSTATTILRIRNGDLVVPLDSMGTAQYTSSTTEALTGSADSFSASQNQMITYTLPQEVTSGDDINFRFVINDGGVEQGRARLAKIVDFDVDVDRADIPVSHFFHLNTSTGGLIDFVLTYSYDASTRILTLESRPTLSGVDTTSESLSVHAQYVKETTITSSSANNYVTVLAGLSRTGEGTPIALKIETRPDKSIITSVIHGKVVQTEVQSFEAPNEIKLGIDSHQYFQSIAVANFTQAFNDQDLVFITNQYPSGNVDPGSLFLVEMGAYTDFDFARRSVVDTSLKSAGFNEDFTEFSTQTQDDTIVTQALPFVKSSDIDSAQRTLIEQLPRAFPHNLPSGSNHVSSGAENYIRLEIESTHGVAYIGRHNSTNLIPVYFNTADLVSSGQERVFSPDNNDQHVIVVTRISSSSSEEFTLYLSTQAEGLGYDRLFYADSFRQTESTFFQGARGEKGDKGDDGIDGSQESGLTIRQKIDSDLVQEHRLRGDKVQGLSNVGWAKINFGVIRQNKADPTITLLGFSIAHGVTSTAPDTYIKAGSIEQVSVPNNVIAVFNDSNLVRFRVNQSGLSLTNASLYIKRDGAITQTQITDGLIGSTAHTASWGSNLVYNSYEADTQFQDGDEFAVQLADGTWWFGSLIEGIDIADEAISEAKLSDDARAKLNAARITQAQIDKLEGVEPGATQDQTAQEIKTSLETLNGDDRLDATAIKNLPEGGGGGGATRAQITASEHYVHLGDGNLSSSTSGLTAGASDTITSTGDVQRYNIRFANNLAGANVPSTGSYNTQTGEIFLPAGHWIVCASVNLVTGASAGSSDRVYPALAIFYGSSERHTNSLYLRNNDGVLPGTTKQVISGKVSVTGAVISDGVTATQLKILHASQQGETITVRGAHVHAIQQLVVPTLV